MERDVVKSALPLITANFNSHAHVERDDMGAAIVYAIQNFNSHAHVERDEFEKKSREELIISTHTLTWSVTDILNGETKNAKFQLTRSRGA